MYKTFYKFVTSAFCCLCFMNETIATADSVKTPEIQTIIPRKILLAKPDKSAVRLNHAGDKIAYIARKDGGLTLRISTLSGKILQEFQVKAARNLAEYFWSHNDDYIFILQDTNGDENNHIIALNLKDGSQKDLTPFKGARSEFVMSDFGNSKELLIACNKRNPQWMDVYRLNYVTGAIQLILENNQYSSMLYDENYKLRIATKVDTDGGTIVYKFNDAGNPIVLKKISFEDSMNSQMILQERVVENRWYYMTSENSDKNVFMVYDLATDKAEKIFSYDKADISGIGFDRRTKKPLMAFVEYLKPDIVSIDPRIDQHLQYLKNKFKELTVSVTSTDLAGKVWIVATSSPSSVAKYYSYHLANKKLTYLFSSQKDLEKYQLREVQPVVIKTRDGFDMVCYLTKSCSSKLIVYVHGGPWCRDGYHFDKTVQFLANRGYSVLQVNYRGSSGFGKKFSNAINKNLDKVRNDIIDAANWAVENGVANRDQIGIMGGSFGGYSTLAGLAFTPDFFSCGVDVVGPSNWFTLFATVPSYWKPYMIGWYKCVGDPSTKEGRAELAKHSPITYVSNIKKPLIVFQGEHDPRVNKKESDMIVAELKKRNIPVSYVLYPDEGHGFVREQNQLSYLAITENFLAQNFGGWFEPINENELKGSTHQFLEKGNISE